MKKKPSFLNYFEELKDPRKPINLLHSVNEILLLTFTAVICGSEGWSDIELFGKCKIDFLRQFFPFKHGIPSDDTLRRFFRCIDINNFQTLFIRWVQSFGLNLDNKVIAIDGKTLRRSFDSSQKALHMVSAFVCESRIVLGQKNTSEKSNEITAIPELLELLDIQGSTITIDAMGCQKKIAQKIIEKKADYIFGLKGNQGNLLKDVELYFQTCSSNSEVLHAQEVDGGHDRIETRKIRICEKIDWLEQSKDWSGLKSIIAIDSMIERKEETSCETRYYISSLSSKNPKSVLCKIRSHWAIENSLHWVLDVSFGEDQSRIRKGNGAKSVAVMRHIALNMLQKVKKKRESIKMLRKKAGWDHTVLKEILEQKV